MKLTEIRVAGFGGQGVMMAASIIGKAAAIHAGGYATMTQNYGPEARGGASSSQLVISDEPVLYPYTTNPDILIALSQEAFTRFAPEMNPRGTLLVEQDLVRLSGLPEGVRVFSVPATRLAEELGKKMVLNVIMVGFLAAKTGMLPKETYQAAIADSVPPASRELNLEAFEKGFAYGLSCQDTPAESIEAEEANPVLAE
jgi:2-oxoglutarate ferredoxin oxidoreductase subunit gamma